MSLLNEEMKIRSYLCYYGGELAGFPDAKGNAFIRKGKVGDWKNYFDDEMNKDWDAWIADQLKDSGFKMEFE